MKLSNSVLTAFFGFIFLYMTAAFTEIRLRGNTNNMDNSKKITETADIPAVGYLILQDLGQMINVIGSHQPRIEVRSISGDLLQKLEYNISGDTLTLSRFNSEENGRITISVYVPESSLTGMTVNGAAVAVKALDQKALNISQTSGWIRMDGNNLGKLQIEAFHKARFEMSGIPLDTLSALIDNSVISINSPVKLLDGSMQNNAYLRMRATNEIRLKKDENSRLYFN